MARLETAEMVYRNNQAVYGKVGMAIRIGTNPFKAVSDDRAIHARTK